MKSNSHSIIRQGGSAVISGKAALVDGKVWIGDSGGLAQERTLSGDATVSNTGVVNLAFPFKKMAWGIISGDNKTWTAAAIANKFVVRLSATANSTDVLPTAAAVLAAMAGDVVVNSLVDFHVWNYTSYTIGIVSTADFVWDGLVTLYPNEFAHFIGWFTNVTVGSVALTGEWYASTYNAPGADKILTTKPAGHIGHRVVTASGDATIDSAGVVVVAGTHSGSAHHNAVTIGADGEHSLATQVLSGVDAAAAQKGHLQLAGELGGTAASPTVAATHSGSAHHAAVTLGGGSDPALALSGQQLTLTLSAGIAFATAAVLGTL